MANDETLTVGNTAYDERISRMGEIIDMLGELVQLRPIETGRIWVAQRSDLRPATAAESLSARAATANTSHRIREAM
ncbi:hypothetical protein [Actinacidiphila rubida]|uniref:Uncharacterized protein n=1 Tax=Actinacidiphila rubida TaxID=310780 RepID=A0A1H8L7N9_9ACTN|nr:hypothetical protein [Actinacidiphila rubida]SEO01194.1 hypothetical protein SAMN05216267_101583 [Actinacidiphila rubida]